MRVLVTGGLGYIGKFICSCLKNKYDIVSTDCRKPEHIAEKFEYLDITDERQVKRQLLSIKPDTIIHLAGIKDLNFSQKNKELTYNINVCGTNNLISVCKDTGAKMIFLSTDYVFDGQKGMYKEEDAVNPQTYYGFTKVEAEKSISESLDNYVIIRTGGVFGSYDGAMSPLFSWLLDNLKAVKPVDAYTDVYNTPTPLEILGEGMDKVIKTKSTGLFHIAGPKKINRSDFFKKIAKHFGFDQALIRPVKNDSTCQSFLRPRDISLDSNKARMALHCESLEKADYEYFLR